MSTSPILDPEAIARRGRIKVVAEGVETGAQARALRECGVECGQGYHYGAAMPAAGFRGLVAARG